MESYVERNRRVRSNLPAATCALVIAGMVATACTSGAPATVVPDPTASSSTMANPTSGNPQTAPAVTHPLDASVMVAQPCSSLTAADVAGLGLVNAAGRAGTDPSSKTGCSWTGDSGGSVSVNWVIANRNGLSDLYAKASTIAYWEPTTVTDYPAAYGDSISDGRSQGDCVLSTAVSNQLYFFAQIDDPLNAAQSCAHAAEAAADVIRNLGGS